MQNLIAIRDKILSRIHTLAIVCYQWGDTGKGKFVDFFSDWADIIARGTGGPNAGHTIVLNGKEYVFHLIPCGILYDKDKKQNVMGSGMVIDPATLCHELDVLEQERLSYNGLSISMHAKLILPQHMVIETIRESLGKGKIGTTGRGVGPAYEDHFGRTGLTINDMLNPDLFAAKLEINLRDKLLFLRQIDPELVKAALHKPRLGQGIYWHSKTLLDVDAIIEHYLAYAKRFEYLVEDTDELIRRHVEGSNILLEGAQGTLLSIDYGSYPFVTSSDCTIRGLAKGVGLSEKQVDCVFGIVKAFYMTRVGEGPFPTELGDEASAQWCAQSDITKTVEADTCNAFTVNDPDPFKQGIAIRGRGNEYGATTGRPRRIGWLDLPLLRHAIRINGPDVILTKVDVLSECDEIRICTHYTYSGPERRWGKENLIAGQTIENTVPSSEILQYCKPNYQSFPGWKVPIADCSTHSDLPHNLGTLIQFVEEETGMKTRFISVGADRNQTIAVA